MKNRYSKFFKEDSSINDINSHLKKYGFELELQDPGNYFIFKYKNLNINLYDNRLQLRGQYAFDLKDVMIELASCLVETIRNTKNYKTIKPMFLILDQIISDYRLNPKMTGLIDGMRE